MTTGQDTTSTDAAAASEDPLDSAAEVRLAALLAGPFTALGIAGALVGVRDQLGDANIGFILMLVVLAAGLVGGRLAGVATALVAALAYNVFHTQPYLSLAVAARTDVISVVLLAVAGTAIGEVGSRAALLGRRLRASTDEQRELEEIAASIAVGAGVREPWRLIRAFVVRHAGATNCEFHRDAELLSLSSAQLRRTAMVPVAVGGQRVGQLLVTVGDDEAGVAALEIARRAAAYVGLLFSVEGSVPLRLAWGPERASAAAGLC